MSFSRVTEEQTLEISRDGSVRFEKSNILDIEFIKNRIPNGQNFILKFVPLFLCIIYGRCQKDANNLMRVHFSHYMNPPSMGNYESFRLSEFVSSKAHVSISTASSIILSLHTIISKAQAPLLSVACSKSYSICTR